MSIFTRFYNWITNKNMPTQPNISQISGLQAALDSKASLNAAALTGTPTAPTATSGTNTTQIATTAFVHSAVASVGSSISLTATGNSGAATLISNVLNVPTYTLTGLLPSLTAGSVLFSNGTTLTQDNGNFVWDNTNKRLGVGGTPSYTLDINGSARLQGTVILSTLTGILKASSGTVTIATADTDYQVPITITTTGTSGAATLSAGILNIPQYSTSSSTYTAGTGLTLTSGSFSVNTTQNITRLTNLTTNGLVKTIGSTGTLAIATAGTDYQAPITLTTTGTGAATLTGGALNIPTPTITALGGITASSTDTITNKNLTSGTNVFPTLNQSTTGNAATATKLATARTINGVSFDGTANISITTASTQITGDNSTNIATTAFVQATMSATTVYFQTGTFTGTGTSASPFTLNTTQVGVKGKTTLVSGQQAITITGASTSSVAFSQPATQSGSTNTIRYLAVCTANTLTIQAYNSSGTVNTSDTSVINYIVYP